MSETWKRFSVLIFVSHRALMNETAFSGWQKYSFWWEINWQQQLSAPEILGRSYFAFSSGRRPLGITLREAWTVKIFNDLTVNAPLSCRIIYKIRISGIEPRGQRINILKQLKFENLIFKLENDNCVTQVASPRKTNKWTQNMRPKHKKPGCHRPRLLKVWSSRMNPNPPSPKNAFAWSSFLS